MVLAGSFVQELGKEAQKSIVLGFWYHALSFILLTLLLELLLSADESLNAASCFRPRLLGDLLLANLPAWGSLMVE